METLLFKMARVLVRDDHIVTQTCMGTPGAGWNAALAKEHLEGQRQLQRERGPANTLALDFWPPDMLNNGFLLF